MRILEDIEIKSIIALKLTPRDQFMKIIFTCKSFFKSAFYIALMGSTYMSILSAADANSKEVESVGQDDVLKVLYEHSPNNLDIQSLGANRAVYGLDWNVYDRLLSHDIKQLPNGTYSYDMYKLRPELAESWEVAEDGMSVIFKLRKDARFHDGTPVTAKDVKWSLDRAVSVGGFASTQMAAGSMEKPEQFIVIDDHTFKIQYLRKDKLLLPDLATPVPIIFNSTLALKHATKDDPWAKDWLAKNTAAGGAYQIEKFEPGVEVVYTRFDDWKSGSLPKIKKVIVQPVLDAEKQKNLLVSKKVDVVYEISPKVANLLSKNPTIKVLGAFNENFLYDLNLNVLIPPFNNQKVREAIAYAIDYESLFELVSYGKGRKLFGAKEGDISLEWPQPFPYSYNPDKAKNLLVEAGFPDGFNTKLYINSGDLIYEEPMALSIRSSLKKINIDVEIIRIAADQWHAEIGKKYMPMAINDFGGWLNYPEYFFFWNYHSNNSIFNISSYQNKEMDKYIETARWTYDKDEYEKNVKAFVKKAIEDVPRIPLFQEELVCAMQKNIEGYVYWVHRTLDFRPIYRQNSEQVTITD